MLCRSMVDASFFHFLLPACLPRRVKAHKKENRFFLRAPSLQHRCATLQKKQSVHTEEEEEQEEKKHTTRRDVS